MWDIKYLMKFCNNLHGGLNKLAETLEVERIGPQHQAGSDSLLTSRTFMKLIALMFSGFPGVSKHRGVLFGLGSDGVGIDSCSAAIGARSPYDNSFATSTDSLVAMRRQPRRSANERLLTAANDVESGTASTALR